MQNNILLTNVTVALLLSATAYGQKIDSTESLMKEIAARYNGKWFKQLRFSQTVDFYENDSPVKTEIWDEEYQFPSNLIIYMTPGDSSNRYICRNDTVFIYSNNELTSVEKTTHDAVILGLDIYNMSYAEIMKRWEDLPYNIDKFHSTECDGKKYYVAGVDEGDTLNNQIWFDAERLLFAKMRKRTPQGIQEMRWLNYVQLPDNKGWFNREVEYRLNGKVYMHEKYFNIQVK
jgi:hypothetical protein